MVNEMDKTRKEKRSDASRIYKRSVAYELRQQGKTLGYIAKYLNVPKTTVVCLIAEYERCKD